jgi:hypothetical protein
MAKMSGTTFATELKKSAHWPTFYFATLMTIPERLAHP